MPSRARMDLPIRFAVVLGLAAWCGCSGLPWSENVNHRNAPAPLVHAESSVARKSRNSVMLGVDFVHVKPTDLESSFWESLDESVFPVRIRQAWLDNGLRIAVMKGSTERPEPLQRDTAATSSGDPAAAILCGAGVMGRGRSGHQSIPMRVSRRHELPLSPILEDSPIVLIKQQSGLIGKQLTAPQFLLALNILPTTRTGQVSLDMRPEIQHGTAKQRFVSSDAAVRIDTARSAWELTDLNLRWDALLHETLVIAPVVDPEQASPTFALGSQMLHDAQRMDPNQHVVLLLKIESLAE